MTDQERYDELQKKLWVEQDPDIASGMGKQLDEIGKLLGDKASEFGSPLHGTWDQGGFFFGIQNMTRDDYEGTVFWKGEPVEHYDHDYWAEDGFEADMEKDARELARNCQDLEARGIKPTMSAILSGENKSNEYNLNNTRKQQVKNKYDDDTMSEIETLDALIKGPAYGITQDELETNYSGFGWQEGGEGKANEYSDMQYPRVPEHGFGIPSQFRSNNKRIKAQMEDGEWVRLTEQSKEPCENCGAEKAFMIDQDPSSIPHCLPCLKQGLGQPNGWLQITESKKKSREFKPELQGKTVNVIGGDYEGKSGTVANVGIFSDDIGVNIDGKDVTVKDGDYVVSNEHGVKVIRASEVLRTSATEGRYMIRDKDGQWEVQELTDDLELAKAIADDSSAEEISGIQEPYDTKGVVFDLDYGQVVYSAENWREVATDLLKETQKKKSGKRKAGELKRPDGWHECNCGKQFSGLDGFNDHVKENHKDMWDSWKSNESRKANESETDKEWEYWNSDKAHDKMNKELNFLDDNEEELREEENKTGMPWQTGAGLESISHNANCPICGVSLMNPHYNKDPTDINTFTEPFGHMMELQRHGQDLHNMSEDEAYNFASKEQDKYDGFAPNWDNFDDNDYPSIGESEHPNVDD